MLMKTGILYFTTCFHGFGILRHVDPFARMLHILERSLTAKVIVSITFSIKDIVFLKSIYVIIMSEDTPECAKLHHLKK